MTLLSGPAGVGVELAPGLGDGHGLGLGLRRGGEPRGYSQSDVPLLLSKICSTRGAGSGTRAYVVLPDRGEAVQNQDNDYMDH